MIHSNIFAYRIIISSLTERTRDKVNITKKEKNNYVKNFYIENGMKIDD